MAALEGGSDSAHKNGRGVRKSKKFSTRIDLTPMVDLGFLLITFFMYTTTMARPNAMEINMPVSNPSHPNEVKESTALTILLSKNHRIYCYKGIGSNPLKPPKLEAKSFMAEGGIRDAIIEKKREVEAAKKQGRLDPKDNATFLIKPDDNSTYEDLVAVLDEMEINDARVYAVVDITAQDKKFIRLREVANALHQKR